MAISPSALFLGPAALLIIYCLTSKITYYLTIRKFTKIHNCKPCCQIPQWERILGLSFLAEQKRAVDNHQFLQMMENRFKKFGNTFQGVITGRPFLFTCEPENIKALLATNFSDFGIRGRKESFGPLLGNGIFTSDGRQWEHSRALIRPSFVKVQVSNVTFYEPHVQELLRLIPKDGSTVDLQPLFFKFTIDSATEYLLGKSVNSLKNASHSPEVEFATSIDFALSQIPMRYRLGFLSKFIPNRRFDDACEVVHSYVDPFVVQAMAEKEKGGKEVEGGRYTLLYQLAKATEDPIQVRSELLNMLVAGRDTTASLLSNVLFILARRPDIWVRLRAEVDGLQGAKPDYEGLRQMKYLKSILNEALRLLPVVPANSRFALRNTVLPCGGGPDGKSPVFIAKGSIVAYSVRDMQRRTDIYGPDADEFKPERWDTIRPGWAYLPFNGGPRICIGQQFALTEMSYVIVRLVQTFRSIEWRGPREEEVWVEKLGVTLSSYHGVKVAFGN